MASSYITPFTSQDLTAWNTTKAPLTQKIDISEARSVTFVNQTPFWFIITDKTGSIIEHLEPYTSGSNNFPAVEKEYLSVSIDPTLAASPVSIQSFVLRLRFNNTTGSITNSAISTVSSTATMSGSLAYGTQHIGSVGIDGQIGSLNVSSATLAQDSSVQAVHTALGSPAQDSSVQAVHTALGSPAQDASIQTLITDMVANTTAMTSGNQKVQTTNTAQAATAGITATSRVSVGVSATALFNGVVNGRQITITNMDANNSLYLGTATVTTATGSPLAAGGTLSLDIIPGSSIVIYGVAAATLSAATMTIN